MAKTLKDIKVGDRVWISARYGGDERGTLKTVVRLTPTQIILDGIEKYNRYQRGKPSRYGNHEPSYYGIAGADGRITLIATAEESTKWDAKKERERQDLADRIAKQEQIETKRREMESLFRAEHVYVEHDPRNQAGQFVVRIWRKDEDAVRELAAKVNELPA